MWSLLLHSIFYLEFENYLAPHLDCTAPNSVLNSNGVIMPCIPWAWHIDTARSSPVEEKNARGGSARVANFVH